LENYEKADAKAVLEEMVEMYPEGTSVGDKVVQLLYKMK
jgi:hypothetical protein